LQDPAIAGSFEARGSAAAASAYLLGAVIGALVCGYLTDRYGRKRLFFCDARDLSLRHIVHGVFAWDFLEFRRISMDHRLRYRRRVRSYQFCDR